MAAVLSQAAGAGRGERLRQAALEMFGREGYHGVSLRRLANAVGLLPGSLYHHFEGKQDLLFELIEDYELEVLQLCKVACGRRSRHPLLADLLEDYLLLVQEHWASARVAHHEFRHLSPEQQARIRTLRRQQVQALSRSLGAGCRDQGIEPDDLAYLLLAVPYAQADDAVAGDAPASVITLLVVELLRRQLRR